MIRGLRTVIYHVTDLAKAKAWYNRVLEKEPYFDQPFYVGYSVGGFELGLIPDGTPGPGGTVAYWAVSDAAAALKRLETLGATVREQLQDVGLKATRMFGARRDPWRRAGSQKRIPLTFRLGRTARRFITLSGSEVLNTSWMTRPTRSMFGPGTQRNY